jgi:hypothetical protein
MTHIGLLALVAFVMVDGIASLPPPTPSPIETGQSQQQHAGGSGERAHRDQDQPGAPVAVSPANSPTSRTESGGQPTADSGTSSSTNWWTAVGTVALAAFAFVQIILIGIQSYFMQQSTAASQRSAEAAERNITDLERPWLIVEPADDDPQGIISRPDEGGTSEDEPVALIAGFKIANKGRSPLWIVTEALGWFWTPMPIPTDRAYPPTWPPTQLPKGPLMPGEERDGFGENVVLTPEQRQSMMEGTAVLVLYGLVVYRDTFGKVHETGYAWHYFRPARPTEWNAETGEWGDAMTGWDESMWVDVVGPEEYIRHT